MNPNDTQIFKQAISRKNWRKNQFLRPVTVNAKSKPLGWMCLRLPFRKPHCPAHQENAHSGLQAGLGGSSAVRIGPGHSLFSF